MDISVQMKSFDMLIKFLKHDLQNIAIFETGYAEHCGCMENSVPLPRSSPEAQGVSSGSVLKLIKAMTETKDINAHSIVILKHGFVIAKGSWAPYKTDCPHMLYSLSKSFTGTAIGIAEQEGLLDLDERITDIFRDKITPTQSVVLRRMTIRHLLTMSSGIRFNEPGTAFCDDWVRMFLGSIPKFEPGSAFEYNSLNSYMLSAVLRRKTGMGLVEYLTPRLFKPLGIGKTDWEVCPKGIEKGGWGLSLTVEDAAKLGQLYLNRGEWNGRQILSRDWVEEATRQQICTPNGECRNGYGYQVWMHDANGAYQFNGAFGQHVIVLPKIDMVIAIMSGGTKLYANSPLGELIQEFASESSDVPLKYDSAAAAKLERALAGLTYSAYDPLENGSIDIGLLKSITKTLNGSEYHLQSNIGGAFPFILQCAHGNLTAGLHRIRFTDTECGLHVMLYENEDCNTLIFRDGIVYSEFTVHGERQPVGIKTQWRRDEDGTIVLFAAVSFIETPNTRLFTFMLYDDKITIRFDENPGIGSAVEMFCEITGFTQIEYYRKLLPALRHERLQKRVREIASPTAQGYKAAPGSDVVG